VLGTLSAFASAAPATRDVLKVDYFSNANTNGAPDATVRLTDPGTAPGNICAYVTVFDPNQEMSECCGCLLTPDGLVTLSVNLDLTSNPYSGTPLTTGVIKIVSTAPVSNACPLPGTSINAFPTLEPSVRAWTTHIQNGNFSVTETSSQDATLSSTETSLLTAECISIVQDGSGHGICTCGVGE
jgi:hypothetical protein